MHPLRRITLTLALVSLVPATARAADDASLRTQIREVTREEGPIEAREEYWALRRQGPGPGFNAAKARFDALRVKSRQQHVSSLAMGTTWTAMGPQPIQSGQTPQNGANRSNCSGRANAIVVDTAISPAPATSPVYAGAAQGGVWKSTDNGANWTPLTDALGSLAVGALALQPGSHAANAAVLYLGTGEGNGSGDSYAGVGVYKSTDSGSTWSGPLGSAQFSARAISSIAVDRTNSNVLLATSTSGIFGSAAIQPATLPARGIYRSLDAGATWACTTCGGSGTDNNRYSNVVQDPVTSTVWFASGWYSGLGAGTLNGGLVKSTDNGATWAQVGGLGGLPAVGSAWGRATVTVAAAPGATAAQVVYYVGTSHTNASGSRQGRVYKSTDSGATWTQLTNANDYCMGQCFYDQPLWAQPDDPTVLYTGGAGAVATGGTTKSNARRSTDGGATFADIMVSGDASTAIHSDTHVLVTDPSNANVLWAASDGGVWRSSDRGTNWVDVNAGLNTVQFTGVDIHPTNPNIVFGGTQDNGTNTWGGALGWSHSDDGDGGFALIDKTTPANAVHTYYNLSGSLIAAVVEETNGANATPATGWPYLVGACPAASCGVNVNNGIAIADRVLFYAPMHLDRGATDTLYFGTNHLYRADGFFAAAATATPTTTVFTALGSNQDLTAGGGAISAIETFAAQAPAHGGTHAAIIYTGSSDGRVFRSTDAGATFVNVDSPGGFISDLAIDPTSSAIVYAANSRFAGSAGQNVRKSTDGGITWAPAAAGIPDIPVNTLVVDPTDHTHVWAGTDIGVYYSSDSGATWNVYGTGLPNVAVFQLRASSIPAGSPAGQLVASTHGRGMWKIAGLTPVVLDRFDAE